MDPDASQKGARAKGVLPRGVAFHREVKLKEHAQRGVAVLQLTAKGGVAFHRGI